MSIINDFKSINSIMNRREQKPEYLAPTDDPAHEQKEPVNVGWPYGPAVPTVNKATAIQDVIKYLAGNSE